MTISFETKTSVFTENAELLGDIEQQDGGGWTFTAAVEMPLSADELIQIGEYVKALNERPSDMLVEDAKNMIERYRQTLKVIHTWATVSDPAGYEKSLQDIARLALDELNGVKG